MSSTETETKAAFARRLGCSKAWVSQLIKKGLPLTSDGKLVPIAEALAWVQGNVSSGGTDNDAPNLNGAKIRLVLANAKRAEFALERERGTYVSRDEVRRAAQAFGRGHRDQMLNFANRFGPGIAAAAGCDAATLIGLIDARMREALLESVGISVPFQGDRDA
ncbi:hypothetical protein Rvan_2049 [Rhodomicrobium vannielii ATCC 17100]|uniref:Uncharacterized protein n=1 Tax=Rhodomicrobium vannielii (strain ATCC 17100 / DSM 162 / LMG 4299 / NCIMB 10020 / ATH 3.1.1) TaxID=648757 RepID=E3I1I6_RHOVT|nr:hypothetical protein [Rhodomicrobium vannielii]ADP71277.1 hypothetical protein Rvan_2049 [Rhodomicrobium vannielii ATCC 17100]